MTFRGQNEFGNVDKIQRAVCDCMELPKGSMRAATRRASVSHPRMLAMYLCRTRLKLSESRSKHIQFRSGHSRRRR